MSGFGIGDIEFSDCGKWVMSRYIGIIPWIQETDSFEYWAFGISQNLCIHNCGNVKGNMIN